jgi:hypothetical protein
MIHYVDTEMQFAFLELLLKALVAMLLEYMLFQATFGSTDKY